MSQLIVERLFKRFALDTARPVVALDDVSISLEQGELLTIVGPSGCGKSTLLRLIAGLEKPDAGDVRRAGRSLLSLEPFRRGVFLAGQNSALYPHLSVRDNLAFGAAERPAGAIAARGKSALAWRHRLRSLCGGSSATANRRLERIADRWECREFWHRRPEELSAGQRQRASLARAALRRAPVCLWDEPLTHLDAPLRRDLRAEIRRLHHETQGHTLYVTHDAAEALAIGDRLAVLRAGRVEQIGSPDAIYQTPANRFVASFAAPWGMNFLGPGCVEGPSRASSGGDAVVIGVRPEQVRLGSNNRQSDAGAREAERRVSAIVEAVEPAGGWLVVRAKVESSGATPNAQPQPAWTVASTSQERPVLGERIELHWDRDAEHRFDAASGLRLVDE